MTVRQLSKEDARALLDYRDGSLFWRAAGSGRRPDLKAVTTSAKRVQINIGGEKYQAHYVVWNWHHGPTAKVIRFADGDRQNIAIENLIEVDNFICTGFAPTAPCCPTCTQPVSVPTYDFIVRHLDLQPLHQKILKAVWDGKGYPVMPGKIFNYMYEDDPDGGPSDAKMYQNFKVALCRLRDRLSGSGVSIATVGYRGGYRLVMEGKNSVVSQ